MIATEAKPVYRVDFAAAVGEHQAMVFSLAYHFLRDRAQGEEIAQEVFLELHRSQATIDSPEHLVHWLRRTALHRSIDAARRRSRRPQTSLEVAAEPSAPAAVCDPLLRAKMQRLVATLPAPARAVVILRFQEDLQPSEIAGVLGMPLATVKSHLHRSLAVLREKLTRESFRNE